jgi:hypothetical protein
MNAKNADTVDEFMINRNKVEVIEELSPSRKS